MQGEGLSSFFGNLLKSAVPFLGKTKKVVAKIAKPHLFSAGKKDIVTAGIKRGVEELNNKLIHKPHKRRKRTKWQRLQIALNQ